MKKVTVTYDLETGESIVETFGFKGEECLHAAEPYKEALGGPRGGVKPKPELKMKSKDTSKAAERQKATE